MFKDKSFFFTIFCFFSLFGQRTADECSLLGWQAYKEGNVVLAVQHFKNGMIAKNNDTDVARLRYSRGYCGYAYGKLIFEQKNKQALTEDDKKSILAGFGLVLQIPTKEERDIQMQKKIQKMQESATEKIKRLDLVIAIRNIEAKNSDWVKAMEALD